MRGRGKSIDSAKGGSWKAAVGSSTINEDLWFVPRRGGARSGDGSSRGSGALRPATSNARADGAISQQAQRALPFASFADDRVSTAQSASEAPDSTASSRAEARPTVTAPKTTTPRIPQRRRRRTPPKTTAPQATTTQTTTTQTTTPTVTAPQTTTQTTTPTVSNPIASSPAAPTTTTSLAASTATASVVQTVSKTTASTSQPSHQLRHRRPKRHLTRLRQSRRRRLIRPGTARPAQSRRRRTRLPEPCRMWSHRSRPLPALSLMWSRRRRTRLPALFNVVAPAANHCRLLSQRGRTGCERTAGTVQRGRTGASIPPARCRRWLRP